MWVVMALCFIIGGIFGTVVMKNRNKGIGLLAGWGGVILGFMVTSSFIIDKAWLFYLILAGFAISAAGIAMLIEEKVITVATAFIGSYAVIRGISLFAGGFPNESTLH